MTAAELSSAERIALAVAKSQVEHGVNVTPNVAAVCVLALARLAGEPMQAPHGFPCPTCSGPSRETVGMVCQTCGTDYMRAESALLTCPCGTTYVPDDTCPHGYDLCRECADVTCRECAQDRVDDHTAERGVEARREGR